MPQQNPERTVDPLLQNHLERELLKYAAGRSISCPACGEIMDARKTVVATTYATPPNGTEIIATQYVQCTACWDRLRLQFTRGVDSAKARRPEANIRSEVVDGRAVFKPRR